MNYHFIWKYILYKLTAQHKYGHGIHPPFVYNLLTRVIEDDRLYYAYDEVEALRKKLLKSDEVIAITDFGAGSKVFKSNLRPVKAIAKHSLKSKKYGQLLFRLVNHFKPQTILELGTSLGVSTIYMAKPNSDAKLFTIEGCPQTAGVAKANFEKLKVDNIEIREGNIDDQLPKLLQEAEQLDFVFFDGNHRKEPTLNYFHQCLEKATNNSVFVFDDIHWSKGMDEAWKEIIAHPKVRVSIDLFHVGLVFFRKESTKQSVIIRF